MTRVLVLAAIDLEVWTLARHLGLARVADRAWPHFRGGALEIVGVGLRGTLIDQRVARPAPPALVVSAGACGALAPELTAGALVVPDTVLGADGGRYPTDQVPTLLRAGTLLTVAEVVATPAAKARLWMETGALAVDMESAMIVAWARARGLAAAVVRGVSDTAAEALPPDLAAVVAPGGRVRAGQALRAALARPRAIADAVTLKRGTDAALRSVASALATLVRS